MFLAAVGDRRGTQDPPWVELDEGYFHWEQHHLPKETGADSAIGKFFSRAENRAKLFDASGEDMEDTATWVPIYPLLPMKVAATPAKQPTTAWELRAELDKFGAGRGDGVKAVLQHGRNWALLASCRGTSARRSLMAREYPALDSPSERLQ